jgi:hypothetical protein
MGINEKRKALSAKPNGQDPRPTNCDHDERAVLPLFDSTEICV